MSSSLSIRHALLATAALALLATPRAAWSQLAGTEGIKQGERFAKAGGETVKVVGEADGQLNATVDAYNALVSQPTSDAKGDYRKLLKNVGVAKEKIAAVKPRIEAMNLEGEAYFKLWASQVANIGDVDLRTRGEERIATTRKEYDAILASLREAATALEPFLMDLTDQINFLGSDLRPEALTSLKRNAENLNLKGQTVFTHTAAAVAGANAFFAPLKAK